MFPFFFFFFSLASNWPSERVAVTSLNLNFQIEGWKLSFSLPTYEINGDIQWYIHYGNRSLRCDMQQKEAPFLRVFPFIRFPVLGVCTVPLFRENSRLEIQVGDRSLRYYETYIYGGSIRTIADIGIVVRCATISVFLLKSGFGTCLGVGGTSVPTLNFRNLRMCPIGV